jgi:hypothetical protein
MFAGGRFPSWTWLDFDDNKLTSQKKKAYGGSRWENKMKTKI